jgi:hypothetical protein
VTIAAVVRQHCSAGCKGRQSRLEVVVEMASHALRAALCVNSSPSAASRGVEAFGRAMLLITACW